MTRAGLFRYVRHERIADYERLGWLVVAELHPPHGHFSVLMQWLCDCWPLEPIRASPMR